MKKGKKLRLLIPLGAALLLAGCGTTRIGRILDEPQHFRNRTVRVQGTVDRSIGAFVTGVYQVEDGTGKIYVLSNSGVPRKGSRVSVKGKVMEGITVGTRSIGTAIREESHKVNY
jgi:hypothetical protein